MSLRAFSFCWRKLHFVGSEDNSPQPSSDEPADSDKRSSGCDHMLGKVPFHLPFPLVSPWVEYCNHRWYFLTPDKVIIQPLREQEQRFCCSWTPSAQRDHSSVSEGSQCGQMNSAPSTHSTLFSHNSCRYISLLLFLTEQWMLLSHL